MLRSALARFPGLAQATRVKRFERSGLTYGLVAEVDLRDGSRLFIRDYQFPNGNNKYSFHWQTADATLLKRWDNEDHWPDVSTFPHHEHRPDGTVGPSYVRSLDEAIEQIARAQGLILDP